MSAIPADASRRDPIERRVVLDLVVLGGLVALAHVAHPSLQGLTDAVVVAAVQAFAMAVGAEQMRVGYSHAVEGGWAFRLELVASFVAVTVLAGVLLFRIGRRGIGDGFALVVLGSCLADAFGALLPLSVGQARDLAPTVGLTLATIGATRAMTRARCATPAAASSR